MQVLVYGRTLRAAGLDVEHELQTLIPDREMEVCSRPGALRSSLRRAGGHFSLAVLICPTKNELLEICSMAHLFLDLRIVLFVPDLEEETVAIGHRLFPRYLASMDAEPEEVVGVLRNLLKKHVRLQA